MKSIAIDLGGTRIKLGLLENGKVIMSAMILVQPEIGLKGHLPHIEEKCLDFMQDYPDEVKGVAVAFPGLVNPHLCKVVSTSGKYHDALGFDFITWSLEKFKLPIHMENDANAALIGELTYGCGVGIKDAVMIILGTGVGTAAMMQGQIVRGKHFQAGCLGGHFTISQNKVKCNCGNLGCVEANASTYALPRIAKEHPEFLKSGLSTEDTIDFIALKKWVQVGDSLAISLLNEFNGMIGDCAVNMIHAYDPELLILSGGVMQCGDMILKPIEEIVHQNAWTPWGKVKVQLSSYLEQSVLLGLHAISVEATNIQRNK